MAKKARKNPAAAALARRRAASLTPEQRKAIAKKAAAARWTPEGLDPEKIARQLRLMTTPIDFDGLIAQGILARRGTWYEVLDIARLPEHARAQMSEVQTGPGTRGLVRFRGGAKGRPRKSR